MWDGGIVGRWAEEHHEILSQRVPFGADSRSSGLQRQPNPVVSAVGGISYSSYCTRKPLGEVH